MSFEYVGVEPLDKKKITKSTVDSTPIGSTSANTVKASSFIDINGNALVIRDSSNNVVWGA